MSEELTLSEKLRAFSKTRPDIYNPNWEDQAKQLMLWAADTIDAANDAIRQKEHGEE